LVTNLLKEILDAEVQTEVCPPWLMRPGRAECGQVWVPIAAIYHALTGQALPEVAPPRERRRIDIVARYPDGRTQAFEVDERQHFTGARATTFPLYPPEVALGYDKQVWWTRSRDLTGREPGGGFARACPPLFPQRGGRHQQRAFRDALADLVPPQYGWLPAVRIGDFQIPAGTATEQATSLRSLLQRKDGPPPQFLRST